MIEKLGLTQFKAFQELPPISIKPLTVLCGKNSSGKSSILQSLLLLKQSLAQTSGGEALTLDGEYLQYTHLREISFGVPPEATASVGYSLSLRDEGRVAGTVAIEFRHKEIPGASRRKGPVVNTFKWRLEGGAEYTIRLWKGTYRWPSSAAPALEQFRPPDGRRFLGPAETKFDGFMPSLIIRKMTPPAGARETEPEQLGIPVRYLDAHLSKLCSLLTRDLRAICYLGPSRAAPRRAYVHYSERHYDLDVDGSNAAHVFWLRRNDMVFLGQRRLRLSDAVRECFGIMGLPQEVSPRRSSKIVYQLMVGINEKSSLTLPDVGFGYSQVLPIILRGLLAGRDATILLEQPEIHLHPAAQARLADLFLAFVESGKRIIVETHSTELINALQLKVVSEPKRVPPSLVNVIFVEPGSLQEGAAARQIALREDGVFSEWPEGFCDESERLARSILEARVQKR